MMKNKQKRKAFVAELEKMGLEQFDDQSTNYGYYSGTKDALVLQLRKLRQILTGDDTVTLFYATTESLNHETIKIEKI